MMTDYFVDGTIIHTAGFIQPPELLGSVSSPHFIHLLLLMVSAVTRIDDGGLFYRRNHYSHGWIYSTPRASRFRFFTAFYPLLLLIVAVKGQ
jgi:hypothetical protein